MAEVSEKPMVTISERAVEQVRKLLAADDKGEDYGVRVDVQGGGCSGLTYDLQFDNKEQPGDQVMQHNGMTIYVSAKSLLYLIGTELDFTDGLNGKGFEFKNPNASRTCACGESFSV